MICHDDLLWSREDVKRAANHLRVDFFWFLDTFFEAADLPIVAFRLNREEYCFFACHVLGSCLLGDDKPLMCHARRFE